MLDFSLRLVTGQRELDSLAERLSSEPAFALDLETADWWDRRVERIALIQLAFREGARLRVALVDALAGIDPGRLRAPLESGAVTKAIHNAAYDAPRLSRHYRIRAAPIHDTMLAARARQVMGVGAVRGSQAAQLGQIYAARTNQVMSAQAGMLFGVNSAGATAALSKSDTQVRTSQGIGDLRVGRDQQSANIEANRAADTQRWTGDKLIMGSDYLGSTIRGKSESLLRRGPAAAVEVVGGGAGLYQQYGSIQNRARGQQSALNAATEGQVANREQAQQGYINNQDVYVGRMTEYHKQYAAGLTGAANASAAQAAGGVNRGASIQISAINQGTGLEVQGNQARYDSQIKAAEIHRDAAMEAARLQALSSVVSRVGSKIARDIEKGLEMRY